MKNLDDLLDACKEVTKSDNRTGIKIGVPNQLVANWRARRSMPSNKHIIAICEIANVDLGEAILAVEFSRENERPVKQAGFASLEFMGLLGAGSLGAMSLLEVSALPYAAAGIGFATATFNALYIMRNCSNF